MSKQHTSQQFARRRSGVGQLSIVEHSLCPLDQKRAHADGLVHAVQYHYSDTQRRRQTANVRIFAPLGLKAADEVYLWGLLSLTLSQPESDGTLTATPHWCLRQLGIIDAGSRRGGRQYRQFAAALERLSVVNYLSNACYDPVRGEYRRVSFRFLSYSLPVDPDSNRAWTIAWDRVFFTMIRETGGSMRFDLDLYRSFDPAARRLFLLVLKVGYRQGRLPVLDLQHLAVDVLGLSHSLAVRDMKLKVTRTLRRLESAGVLSAPAVTRFAPGRYRVSFERGEYLSGDHKTDARTAIENSPLIDGLTAVGFELESAVRIVKRYPHHLVAQWTDITQAAIERFGMKHFRKSPMAFLVDSLSKAAKGLRTPPDWWHEVRKQEQQKARPTAEGRKVLGKLLNEVFGPERSNSESTSRPESAADLLKTLA